MTLNSTKTAICRGCHNYVDLGRAAKDSYDPGDGTVICLECDVEDE